MTCSSCSGASPAMPDAARQPRRRPVWRWLPIAFLLVIAAASTPVAALAAPPAETCAPQETRAAAGFQDICGAPPAGGGGGGAGLDLGSLLPVLGLVGAAGVVALVAAFVILRRTSAPMTPADPGEWWTCQNCGKTNVIGSARCYACGAWQR